MVGFYYNPNIHPDLEYNKRLAEAKKLADSLGIDLIIPKYDSNEYFEALGLKDGKVDSQEVPPQAERCPKCWALRLRKTAAIAREMGIRDFGTTLRISPYQDQAKLLELGEKIAEENMLNFYDGDLKTCFQDSIKMSKEQGMYRQKYCGCIYSHDYRD